MERKLKHSSVSASVFSVIASVGSSCVSLLLQTFPSHVSTFYKSLTQMIRFC